MFLLLFLWKNNPPLHRSQSLLLWKLGATDKRCSLLLQEAIIPYPLPVPSFPAQSLQLLPWATESFYVLECQNNDIFCRHDESLWDILVFAANFSYWKVNSLRTGPGPFPGAPLREPGRLPCLGEACKHVLGIFSYIFITCVPAYGSGSPALIIGFDNDSFFH